MHLAGVARRAPTPSSLSHERALALHRFAHLAAITLLAAGFVVDNAALVIAAAAAGAVGAAGFGVFFVISLVRVRRARTSPAR